MILRDKNTLDIAYVTAKAPCRKDETMRLVTLLKSGHAVLCGDTGTGKTLLAKQRMPDVYVNCYSHKSEYKILEEILRQTRPTFSTAGLTPQRLWREIHGDHLIVLDEMDGIVPEDIQHFAYTLSRQPEIAQRIRYVAITRSSIYLKSLIDDPATWSTFGEKCCVELEPYTLEEIVEILKYRCQESLHPGTYPPEILTMIAHIALVAEGHMRAGIDILRNSALIAESKDHECILPEDIREANREGWVRDINELTVPQKIVLLSVAYASKNSITVPLTEIVESYRITCENHHIKPEEGRIRRYLEDLANINFIYPDDKDGYMILDYPVMLLIDTLEGSLQKMGHIGGT